MHCLLVAKLVHFNEGARGTLSGMTATITYPLHRNIRDTLLAIVFDIHIVR